MSKLDKDQLNKISGGAQQTETTENFRDKGDQSSHPIGVYWDGETAELDDNGSESPSIKPNR